MNNNKTTNILLGILIVVLIAIGIMLIKTNRHKDYNEPVIGDSMSSEEADYFDTFVVPNPKLEDMRGVNGDPIGVKPTSKKVDWNSFPKDEVWALIDENNLSFERDFGIHLSQTIDLTGDGIPEGIFGGNGGNNGAATVLISNPDGVNIAKMKNKNGTIGPIYVYSVGRVMVNENYNFIPNENGFYMVSKTFDESADNSDSSHFICGADSVSAYQWNPKTNLFEYNSTLTAKYTAIECK